MTDTLRDEIAEMRERNSKLYIGVGSSRVALDHPRALDALEDVERRLRKAARRKCRHDRADGETCICLACHSTDTLAAMRRKLTP